MPKETLFEIIDDLINKFGDKNKNKKTEKDLYEYIVNFLKSSAKDELKDLGIKEMASHSSWNKVYKKIK